MIHLCTIHRSPNYQQPWTAWAIHWGDFVAVLERDARYPVWTEYGGIIYTILGEQIYSYGDGQLEHTGLIITDPWHELGTFSFESVMTDLLVIVMEHWL